MVSQKNQEAIPRRMATGKVMYSRSHDLGSRKTKERDRESGEMKENAWHKFCKEYAGKENVSYAAAISLAGPAWKKHKEENGIVYRPRSKPKEREEEEATYQKKAPTPRKRQEKKEPKENFRKGNKRAREEEESESHVREEGSNTWKKFEEEDARHPVESKKSKPPAAKRSRKSETPRKYESRERRDSDEDEEAFRRWREAGRTLPKRTDYREDVDEEEEAGLDRHGATYQYGQK